MMSAPSLVPGVLTAAQADARSDWLGWALIGVAALLWAGWTVQMLREWKVVWESQARLGYLLADTLIVAPGCIASGIGLLGSDGWGAPLLLLTVGAAAYDLTHFFVYMFQSEMIKIKGKGLAWWVYAILTVVAWAGLGFFAYEAIGVAMRVPPAQPPLGIAIGAGVAVLLIVLALSLRRKPPHPGDWEKTTGRLRGW
jgi:hypothetical protein